MVSPPRVLLVLRRLGAGLRDLFPWTPLGVGLGASCYAALRAFAYAQLDLVWLVAGYVVLGLCALSPLFVVPASLLLFRRRGACAPGELLVVETGTPARTGFALPSLALMPLVQVRWQWRSPAAEISHVRGGRGLLGEQVVLDERGEHARIERRVIVSDPFGLARVAFVAAQVRTLRVLPRLLGLRQLPELPSLAPGSDLSHPLGLPEGDRLELARYSPSDPARFIHWKVLARTRRLMVRKPERALSVAHRAAAFLIAGPSDDATAAVARLALERGLLGPDWTFGTDPSPVPTSDAQEALLRVLASVRARDAAGAGLPRFLAAVDAQGPCRLIVFGPPSPGRWVNAVEQVARSRRVHVVIGVDGLAAPRRRGVLARLFWQPDPSPTARVADLEAVAIALGRAGARVSLIDRVTGQWLAGPQRRAMARAAVSAERGAA